MIERETEVFPGWLANGGSRKLKTKDDRNKWINDNLMSLNASRQTDDDLEDGSVADAMKVRKNSTNGIAIFHCPCEGSFIEMQSTPAG